MHTNSTYKGKEGSVNIDIKDPQKRNVNKVMQIEWITERKEGEIFFLVKNPHIFSYSSFICSADK